MRLDHDRRAWIEAEAGRRGVTIRALFEEFIDRARTAQSTGPAAQATPTPDADGVPTSRPWPCSELARVPGLPGAAIRAVLSVTSAVVRAGGGCVVRGSSRAGAASSRPPASREGP
ncbi:MAG: hypothetical protein ACLPYY_00650 [Acidimicrobiales bacterium]